MNYLKPTEYRKAGYRPQEERLRLSVGRRRGRYRDFDGSRVAQSRRTAGNSAIFGYELDSRNVSAVVAFRAGNVKSAFDTREYGRDSLTARLCTAGIELLTELLKSLYDSHIAHPLLRLLLMKTYESFGNERLAIGDSHRAIVDDAFLKARLARRLDYDTFGQVVAEILRVVAEIALTVGDIVVDNDVKAEDFTDRLALRVADM